MTRIVTLVSQKAIHVPIETINIKSNNISTLSF